MAINWDSYEKKAKQITANAKQKNKKTYVGGKSASEVSGKNTNKNKTTTKLFPSKSEIAQGLGESAASINKLRREAEKAQEKAKKDGLKKLKETTERSASEIAEDLGNSIGEMHKQERTAKEKSRDEKAKLKAQQRQAEERTAEKKLATKSDKQANAAAKREHRSTATKTGKKDIDAGTKRIIANTKPYAFISAAEDELANNSLLGIGYAWVNGKKMADGGGQYDAYTTLDNAIKNRTIRKAGEMTGIGGSYLMSYGTAGAAAKAAAATNAGQKAIAKLAGSKLGQASASAAQNTITKLAGTKVGQRIGKETITGVARGAAKDLAGDVTVGTVMNSGQARSLGLEGWDFAGYMGQQFLADLGLGALGELAPVVYRAIKGTKLAKQAGNIVDAAADGATATTKSTGATVLKKTAKEQQNEYLEELADQIKNVDKQKEANNARTATDGRRTQSNKRVQNAKVVIGGEVENMNKALDSEYDELINEYAEVAGMTPDEFVEWKANKNAPDVIVNPETGEAIPNPAKQTGNTTVDPATGETIPNAAKAAQNTTVDPTTGETIPNTAKAAQEGTEKTVEGAEKSAADAFEEGDLTPESKKKVYDAVQKRTGVKIVEEEFAGDIANSDGYYKDGVIHINANSKQPKYTVLKHELTHHMQSSKKYDAFSEFIFDNLKRKGFDIDDLRAKKIASYAKSGVDLSMKDADFELVAEYCGEFLFNSQKSIDRLARENYTLATWVLDWIKDTIAKIGKSDDAKFLIDAQRKYEYALRNADVKVDGKQWNLYAKANKYEEQIGNNAEKSGKTAEEIKRDHNLHRGFKGDWLTEVDDSKARLNTTELEKAKKGEKVNLRNLLEHKELWRKVGEDFDGYRVTFGRLKNDEAGAEIDYAKKLITISNQSKGKTDSQILSSLLHETQHALQDYYGLPHGANINLWDKILSKNDKAYKDAAKEAQKGLDQFQGGVDDLESLNTGIEVDIDFGDIRDLNYEEAWNYLNSFERKAKRRHIFEGEVEEAWNRAEEGLRNADFYSSGNDHLAKLAYHNTAGELEAYDVQSRMGLSKEGRKKSLPRQRNENTRYVEDYGYYPDKSSLYVKATPEEAREQIISGHDESYANFDKHLHIGFGGDWLYEINDSNANWGKKMLELKDNPKRSIPLKDAIDHPELWKRLEETGEAELLDGYKVNVRKLKKGIRGECDPNAKQITLSPDAGFSTMVHEIQHAIQHEQNLPGGANPEFWAGIRRKYDEAYREFDTQLNETISDLYDKAEDLDLARGLQDKGRHNGERYEKLSHRMLHVSRNDIAGLERIVSQYEKEMTESGISGEYIEELLSEIRQTLRERKRGLIAQDDIAFDDYYNTAGEIEARDAAKRLDFTDAERRGEMPHNKNHKVLFTDGDFERQFLMAPDITHKLRFSTGENVIKDPDLKKTSQNLYGEKGNKYLQTASEAKATAKSANTELPKSGTKAENKLPTKNGKKQAAANGKAESVSADAKNPEAEMTYEQASKRYETYKNGTPKKLPAKGDVSKAADTIIGSDVIGDEMREAIKENVSNYVKVTKTNRTTIDNVAAKIDSVGLEDSIKNFRNTLAKKNRFNEEDIAMGAEILRRLDDLGDYERALDITDDLVEMMSQAGRTLQAANIFTSMTPYGKLRSIKRAAAKMSERYGKNVEVNEDLMKELFEAKDSAKADKIKQRIFEDLWNQVPSSLMEKLDALRYTAMLSSPKTHIRNILGNVAMYVGKSLSDGVEAGLEKTVFKGKMEKLDANRTKSFLNPLSSSDKELKKKAGEIFESVKEQLMNGSSKYIEKGDVRPQNSRVFKSKTLEAGRKLVSGSLEKEDEWFMKMNFQAAFAKICKANGLEVGELTARELRQYTAYAAEQAQAATFRDPNALASAMNKVYRWANDTSKSDAVGKLGRGLVKATMDATVPFRRTPANILKQAWRYSPGGVAEGMTRIVAAKDAESLLKGIEILSNGVVGTPIVLAGAYLGYQGIVTGSVGDYSDKKTTYDKMLGDQDYAVNTKKLGELFNVNIGDTTITMDWLSPYSMPFFVGTELGTALSNQEGLEGLTATQLVDAMASITEPFLEMSMMQGVQDLITQSYNGNAVEVMATNQMKTYVTQFVPTLLSQIAKTVAEEKTTTKTVNDGTVAGKSFASTIAQLKSKVPGLYETNQPDVDVWGRTETKEDVWDYVRAGVRNILSPANVKDINITDVDKEILSVYDSLDDDKATVIPTVADSSVTYKGVDYKMTDEELTAYKKDVGKYRYNGLNKLFKTSKYKNSSAQEKAKMITDVYSEANDVAKKNFLISSGNMTEEEYNATNITSKAATKLISSGKTTATKVTEAKGVLEDAGVEKAVLQAYVLDGRYDKNTMRAVGGYTQRGTYKISDTAISKAQGVKKAGLGLTQLQNAYVKADKDGSSTITKEEATNYLNKTGYSQAQKRALFAAIITNSNTHNPY